VKVLIVDDSPVMRKIVTRGLRQAGFTGHTIEEAGNGKEGLEKVQSFEPDLILSDWNMPEMSGIEFLETLREQGCRIPFCFVTSEASEEMRSRAISSGAEGLVTKPFTPDALQKQLGKFLG